MIHFGVVHFAVVHFAVVQFGVARCVVQFGVARCVVQFGVANPRWWGSISSLLNHGRKPTVVGLSSWNHLRSVAHEC